MRYIAHTKDGKNYIDDKNTQSLKKHLDNVSKYTKKYSEGFGAGEIGSLIGLVHDLGKYQMDFQERIRGRKIKVDHSTLGAKVLIDKEGDIGRLYGMVVAGHHTGLMDSGDVHSMGDYSYASRLNNYNGEDANYQNEICIPTIVNHKSLDCDEQSQSFAIATYLRMLFSALVDADWTDTEEYVCEIKRESVKYSIKELNDSLISKLPTNNGSYLNNIRAEILTACQMAAEGDQGLYTLTVPTGGGKTLSSLSFALKHALKHNLKRVIYVIPYTSIIEQNADVISKCLGKEFILEHHSNVDITIRSEEGDQRTEGEDKEEKRLKWASENWDIPIILTTNVQFFESIFSNKPSKTRKIHNIAESVVIFDEAQMLPREFLSPTMYAISELVRNYRVTAVLCSATQPAISNYKYNKINITEIMKNPLELFEKLKRVEYEIIGKKDDREILELFLENKNILCIVNSRRHAHTLYILACEKCGKNVYHLSTLMNAIHRREVLKVIREKLSTNQNVIVISTSLIEAGVDIDFPVVIRSIAGIDSIIQAGGRANREGKLTLGKVIVFEPTSEDGKIPKAIQSVASITKEVISVLNKKAFELEGIKMYFDILYNASSSDKLLDAKDILNEFDLSTNSLKLNFETVAKKYKLIEDNTKSIIINMTDESNQFITEIRQGIFKRETIRKLQQYSISIYENEFLKLLKDNALEVLRNGYIILNNNHYYNQKFGLDIYSNDNKNAECSMI